MKLDIGIYEEHYQLEISKVCHLVPPLTDSTIIGIKWVFRNKRDEYETITRNKKRLVVQGYNKK